MGNFAFVEYDHPLGAEDAVRVRVFSHNVRQAFWSAPTFKT